MSNKAYVAGQGLVVRHFQELLNLITSALWDISWSLIIIRQEW
jgi:hypothetical protein